MMKTILIAVFGLCVTLTSYSQVQFSVFAGPQYTSANYKVNNVKQNTTGKIGAQLGMGMKVEFENRLYFTPAIYYSLKGYKVKYTELHSHLIRQHRIIILRFIPLKSQHYCNTISIKSPTTFSSALAHHSISRF